MFSLSHSLFRRAFEIQLAVLLCAPASAAVIISPIDEFDDIDAPEPAWNRVLDLRITANPWNQSASMRVSDAGEGYLVVGLGPGVVADAVVEYSAAAGEHDLSSGGESGLVIDLRHADIPGEFSVTLTDHQGRSGAMSLDTHEPIREATGLVMPFSSMGGDADLDLARIASVTLRYSPSRDGADLLIDSFGPVSDVRAAVPEPGVVGLVSASVAFSFWRRRARQYPEGRPFAPAKSSRGGESE